MDWIDYYDSNHTIYVSALHRDLHFRIIAHDIIDYITDPDAVVIDYSCGEALSAEDVAKACGRLILAEPAPSVRERLSQRFAGSAKITVSSLDDLALLAPQSVDLVVMNSVSQYMTPAQLEAALRLIRGLLKPTGRLVLGDVLNRDVGLFQDAIALLRFARRDGFLKDAVIGLVSTALSDYRRFRSRIGVQTYSEASFASTIEAAGLVAQRAAKNIGHNPWRMTFIATPQSPGQAP